MDEASFSDAARTAASTLMKEECLKTMIEQTRIFIDDPRGQTTLKANSVIMGYLASAQGGGKLATVPQLTAFCMAIDKYLMCKISGPKHGKKKIDLKAFYKLEAKRGKALLIQHRRKHNRSSSSAEGGGRGAGTFN